MSAEPERPAPGPEGELEELLRRVPPERVDAARRAQARAAFLAGTAGPEAPSRAGGRDRMGGVTDPAEDEAFAAWLARRAVVAPAREEVRRRARLAFLTALAGEPVRQRRRSPAFRGLVLALAAAAIALVTFFLPKPERWGVDLDGPLRFAGVDYAPGDGDRLAAELEASGRVETAGARARFSFGQRLDVELRPATSVEFPPLAELDGVSTLVFEVDGGEAYVRTGAGYPGNPIRIRTALADVALHGTTVGVLVGEGCVCVCVADGTARVESPHLAGGVREVGPRATLQVFATGSEAGEVEPFPAEADEHTRPLEEFFQGP